MARRSAKAVFTGRTPRRHGEIRVSGCHESTVMAASMGVYGRHGGRGQSLVFLPDSMAKETGLKRPFCTSVSSRRRSTLTGVAQVPQKLSRFLLGSFIVFQTSFSGVPVSCIVSVRHTASYRRTLYSSM
jgi:hypothetical protein